MIVLILMCDLQWNALPEGCDFTGPPEEMHICSLEDGHVIPHECLCGKAKQTLSDDPENSYEIGQLENGA